MNCTKNMCSKLFTLLSIFTLFSFGLMAQQMPPAQQMEVKEDFKDDELKEFVKINKELMPLQEKSQEKMVDAIEDSGLTVERFQALAQAQQSGSLTEVAEGPEEMAQFNEAGQKVMGMQEELQSGIQKVINDSKLSETEFQQMYMAYTQSPKVKEKVDELMDKEND